MIKPLQKKVKILYFGPREKNLGWEEKGCEEVTDGGIDTSISKNS